MQLPSGLALAFRPQKKTAAGSSGRTLLLHCYQYQASYLKASSPMATRTSVILPQNQGPQSQPSCCLILHSSTYGLSHQRKSEYERRSKVSRQHLAAAVFLVFTGSLISLCRRIPRNLMPLHKFINVYSILACNDFLYLSSKRKLDNRQFDEPDLTILILLIQYEYVLYSNIFFIQLLKNSSNLVKSNQDNLQNCPSTTVFHANCYS